LKKIKIEKNSRLGAWAHGRMGAFISTLKANILRVMLVEHIFVLVYYILIVLSDLVERRTRKLAFITQH